MKAYLSIFKARFLTLFQYRAAALAGLSTQIFWGILKMMILQAFYAQGGLQPISLEQSITFIWIGQAFLRLLPWNIDKEVEEQVKSGGVAYELIRPIDLYGLWYFRSMAMTVVPTVMRALPLFILAGLFFGLSGPNSFSSGVAFLLSLFFAFLLSSAITAAVIISLFWTLSGEGILRLLPSIVMLLSGIMVPLPLYPDWMQPFLNLQPLRGLVDIPIRLYTGIIPADQLLYYLAFQLVWTLFFVLLGKALLKIAMKRLVIQGG